MRGAGVGGLLQARRRETSRCCSGAEDFSKTFSHVKVVKDLRKLWIHGIMEHSACYIYCMT